MTFKEERDLALDRLSATTIRPANYAPPIYRVMWWLGLPLAPPHVSGFVTNALVAAGYFSVLFGGVVTGTRVLLGQTAANWHAAGQTWLIAGVPAGCVFGLGMATYYLWSARKHGLGR